MLRLATVQVIYTADEIVMVQGKYGFESSEFRRGCLFRSLYYAANNEEGVVINVKDLDDVEGREADSVSIVDDKEERQSVLAADLPPIFGPVPELVLT